MQNYSFYYRDSFDLKRLYPNAYKFSLLYPDQNLVIDEGLLHLVDPESFNPSRIHNIICVYPHKYDYFKIGVSIRCWRDCGNVFKEVTPFGKLKHLKLYKILRRMVNKFYPLSYNTLLWSFNGLSYYTRNSFLVKKENGKIIKIGKMPKLIDPVYYEFLPFGLEAFFRTGPCIYLSSDNMLKWNLIYEGKRGIKNTMVWIEKEQALLFSEYTSGAKLDRHNIYKYYLKTAILKPVFTFYSPDEFFKEGLFPYCRHIHVLMRDPYTNDIYMGVGDADDESAVLRSTDNGKHFLVVGSGCQSWRTLSFIFTKDCIIWNTDSPDPQFLCCLKRAQLKSLPIKIESINRYPIYNSASWNSFYDGKNDMFIMSASCEGMLYDDLMRIYSIKIENDIPTISCLYETKSGIKPANRSNQLFVLGKDSDKRYWFYDTSRKMYRLFVLNDACDSK